jgi:hypothetical protein
MRNTILSSECGRTKSPVVDNKVCPDLSDLYRGQLGSVATLSMNVSSFPHSVSDVVSSGSKKHVSRVATAGIVSTCAIMTDLNIVSYFTSKANPHQAVDRVALSLGATTTPVAVGIVVTQPRPTSVGIAFFFDLRPEASRVPRLIGVTRVVTKVSLGQPVGQNAYRVTTGPALRVCGELRRWVKNGFRHIVVLSCDLFRALGKFKLPEPSVILGSPRCWSTPLSPC